MQEIILDEYMKKTESVISVRGILQLINKLINQSNNQLSTGETVQK